MYPFSLPESYSWHGHLLVLPARPARPLLQKALPQTVQTRGEGTETEIREVIAILHEPFSFSPSDDTLFPWPTVPACARAAVVVVVVSMKHPRPPPPPPRRAKEHGR